MTITTVLAAGTTAATSTAITLAAGEVASVGLFVDSGNIPVPVEFNVIINTAGTGVSVGKLTYATPAALLNGPGVFVVKRPNIAALGVNVGVWSEK